jgi:hypothetical protein
VWLVSVNSMRLSQNADMTRSTAQFYFALRTHLDTFVNLLKDLQLGVRNFNDTSVGFNGAKWIYI